MTEVIKFKRTTVPGKIPTNGDLPIGTLALNINDGKIFLKRSGSLGEQILQSFIIGAQNSGSSELTGSLSVTENLICNNVGALGSTGYVTSSFVDASQNGSIGNDLSVGNNINVRNNVICSNIGALGTPGIVSASTLDISNDGNIGNNIIVDFITFTTHLGATGIISGSNLRISNNARIFGNLQVDGIVSKGGGSFRIEHPVPEKSESMELWHSFVESPSAGENLYRYFVSSSYDNQEIEIELPDYFPYINKDVQVWVSPYRFFSNCTGWVSEDLKKLHVLCEKVGKYNVLVIGTRSDKFSQNWKGAERTKETEDSTILVIDDDKNIRDTLSEIMELNNFKVKVASNGKEGLKIFKEDPKHIDLILLDLRMPIMNGKTTFNEIRKIQPDQNVLIITGFSDDLPELMDSGIKGVVKKPFRMAEIVKKIKKINKVF